MVSTQDKQDQQEQEVQQAEPTIVEPLLPSNVVLKLDRVSKVFGPVQAVKDASLEVLRGEVLALLGPAGSGKTTMLRMAVGLERASEGEVFHGGRVVDSPVKRAFVPPQKRNIGMVFQSHAVWPHMTVFENVAYPLTIRRAPSSQVRDRVGDVLEQVGLAGYQQRSANALTAAERQRVAIARSIVFEPDILLLDDPFSGLDSHLRESMRTEFRALQQRSGISMLFATRDQAEALGLSDRIAVLDQGNIEQVASPMQLYARPATPVVQQLVGRTITFHGQVVRRDAVEGVSVQLQDESGPLVVSRHAESVDLSRGDNCVVTVRPEAIEAFPSDGTVAQRANTLVGKVAMLLFLGDRFEAAVQLPWGQTISIQLPSTDQWRQADEIVMHLPDDQVRVWPE